MPTPITGSALSAAYQNFNFLFQRGAKNTSVWHPRVAMQVPSSTEEEIYPWMQGLLNMRRWKGERKVQVLGANSYRLKNEPFEQTIGVDRTKIQNEKLGLFGSLFEQMGERRAKFPDIFVKEAIQNGHTEACWDGEPFFSNSHPIDPNRSSAGTFDNLHSLALTEANFNTVYGAMAEVADESGTPMGLTPDLLVVPMALRTTALEIVKAPLRGVTGEGSKSNVNENVVEVLVLPELASEPTAWYLMRTRGPLKPFIYQLRSDSGLVRRDSLDCDPVFNHDRNEYGVTVSAAFGYGLPCLAAKSKP